MKYNFTLQAFACTLLLLIGLQTVQAQVVTSNSDDGSPGTLRSQIMMAPAGSAITFAPGISEIILTAGEIAIDKSITLTGNLSGTNINGNASGRIFNITSGDVILNDLTISNGLADNGGGILVTAASLILTNTDFTANIANGASGSGGALFIGTGATLSAAASTFSGNRANRAGGAIEAVAGTTVTLNNVDLMMNNAGVAPATAAPGNGGGLHVTGMGTVTITGGNVSMNIAAAEGGGLWNGTGMMMVSGVTINGNIASGAAADNGGGGIYNLNGGSLMIDNSVISNNIANGASGSGGGILNDVGSTLSVSATTISNNTANRAGGGIENNAGTITLTNVLLNENTTFTSPGNGGGLHITGMGMATIDGGTVNDNDAGAEGGGLWNGTGTMTIDGTTISGNTASGVAADQGGGGIYNLNGGTITISDVLISNNVANGTAGSGGGILNDLGGTINISASVISGNTSNRAGGGIENNAGTITLNNVSLNQNTTFTSPGNGGGLHVTGMGTTTLTGGTVNNNMAGAEGGGLWNGTGMMTIDGATVSGNTASGAAADQGGGGIYNLNGGTLTITDSIISNNIANGTLGSGGGILNDVGSQLSVSNSQITGNTAIRAGGGIEDNSGTSTIILNGVNLDGNSVSGPPGNGGGLHITGGGNVTITGGTVNDNTASLEGGGLWNGSGTMNILNTEIDSNIASGSAADDGGGGIFNNAGTLMINGAMITGNLATGASGSGGGLLSLTGAITIMNATFEENSANRAGGAIEVVIGTLSLTDTNLTNNDVDGSAGTPNPGNGGGIHISGATVTTIERGFVEFNDARREGGGLWNQTGGTMTINDVVVDSNTASGPDVLHGGGGIFNNGGDFFVNTSTISNNSADGTAGNGGGIHVKAGSVTVSRSTISSNMTTGNGGGVYSNATFNANAVTIANNSATMMGGGLSNNAMMAMVKNSIIATNEAGSGEDISNGAGNLMSQGYNLIGEDDLNQFTAMSTDLEGSTASPIDPMIGPLANNGGDTFTHMLLPGSPAYNMGDAADQFNDQIDNPVFALIRDIGSYESQAQLSVSDNTIVNRTLIYPNPSANGIMNLNISDDFGDGINGRIIEIASGKTTKVFTAFSGANQISLDGFAGGIYIVQLNSGSSSETHKLVIAN